MQAKKKLSVSQSAVDILSTFKSFSCHPASLILQKFLVFENISKGDTRYIHYNKACPVSDLKTSDVTTIA